MLKIYTDKKFLKSKYRTKIFPILLDIHFLKNKDISKYFRLVDNIKDADIAIFPIEYTFALKKYNKTTISFLKKSKNLNIWIFSGGDHGYSVNEKNVYNFRQGGFRSKLTDRDIIIPSFISDPYAHIIKDNYLPISKEEKPKIGFVGHANNSFLKLLSEFKSFIFTNIKRVLCNYYLDYQSFYPSSIIRYNYMMKMVGNQKINTNFILRKNYRAGAKTEEIRQETTNEFYNNLYENPYTFCIRGGGNFSVRFYESIATGRIPILIDTDCPLPLANKINWKNHALIINSKAKVNEKVLDFHKKITNYDFIKMQEGNRLLYLNTLNRKSFFKNIHDIFIKNIQN